MTYHKREALRNAGVPLDRVSKGKIAYHAQADATIAALLEIIKELRPSHVWVDNDNWYSCPKAPDGCDDNSRGPGCDCGADKRNAAIDAKLRGLGLVS